MIEIDILILNFKKNSNQFLLLNVLVSIIFYVM